MLMLGSVNGRVVLVMLKDGTRLTCRFGTAGGGAVKLHTLERSVEILDSSWRSPS